MGWVRITIARLLLIIVYFGVGFAALRSPSWIWSSTIFSAMVGLLAASTLTAIYRLGPRRAFWTGFALFGWLYLGLSSCLRTGSDLSPLIVTSALMDFAYPAISDVAGGAGGMFVPGMGAPGMAGMRGAVVVSGSGPTTEGIWAYWSQPSQGAFPFHWAVPEPFRVICHGLLTPIVALVGGFIAIRLHRTSGDSRQ
jgi:hypothetical protein